ncbi:hypothetical protein VTH06DRAFT_3737 [Thermothelomyces fergusii]
MLIFDRATCTVTANSETPIERPPLPSADMLVNGVIYRSPKANGQRTLASTSQPPAPLGDCSFAGQK